MLNDSTPNDSTKQLDTDEIWLPVPDYEGVYEVSNYGRIKLLTKRKPVKTGKIAKMFGVSPMTIRRVRDQYIKSLAVQS